MLNVWKIIITFPKFLQIIIKSKHMIKKIKKNPNIISEEYRYYWLQKQCKYILWIFNIKLIPHNTHNWINKSCLMVANHQSNIDPILIFYLNDFNKTPPCAFIAKKELIYNKKIKNLFFLIDVLFLDRNNIKQTIEIMEQAYKLIRTPRTMVVFPEGKRSHNQFINEFHPGSFKIAQKSYTPIIPVSIINSYQIMNKHIKKKGKKYIHILFHKPIKPDTFISKPTNFIADIVKKIIKKGINKYTNVNHKMAYKEFLIKQKNKNQNL